MKNYYIYIILSILILVMVYSLVSLYSYEKVSANERPYIHQLSDYLVALEKAKKGEWYGHFRPACQPNEEFRNDSCMRGFIMFNLTEALRGMYYVDNEDLKEIEKYYADSRIEVMFSTRIVTKKEIVEVKSDITKEDLDEAVKVKILYLLNQ